jgi:hypothetical protein
MGNLACALSSELGFEFAFDFTGARSFPPLFYGKGGGFDAALPTSQHGASLTRRCLSLRTLRRCGSYLPVSQILFRFSSVPSLCKIF